MEEHHVQIQRTYTGVFDDIRDLFAQTNEAKMRGYDKGRFSFNVKGGRCEACQGDGLKKISMHFLPDVYVPCEQCEGKRYNEETLQVTYKDKNIYDVLEMTVEEALDFFDNLPKLEIRSKHFMMLVLVILNLVKVQQLFLVEKLKELNLQVNYKRSQQENCLYS